MITASSVLAYSGAYQDPITHGYPLGHGYRHYLPALMRFSAPDDASPFGRGGINAYAYCAGDPINRVDPSGRFHLGWQAWLGIGLGAFSIAAAPFTGGSSIAGVMAVASGATAIGSGLASGIHSPGAHAASSILGWVSLGTGLAGVFDAIGTMAARGVTAGTDAAHAAADVTEPPAGPGLRGGGEARGWDRQAFWTRIRRQEALHFEEAVQEEGMFIPPFRRQQFRDMNLPLDRFESTLRASMHDVETWLGSLEQRFARANLALRLRPELVAQGRDNNRVIDQIGYGLAGAMSDEYDHIFNFFSEDIRGLIFDAQDAAEQTGMEFNAQTVALVHKDVRSLIERMNSLRQEIQFYLQMF